MIGLALEGGGTRGAYQFGAWKAFRKLGVEFDGIVGTSIGALNGALMIQNDFERAHEIWSEIAPEKVMRIDPEVYELIKQSGLNSEKFGILKEQFQTVFHDAGIDISPLEKMIRECTKEDLIRKSKKDFGIVTVSLTNFKPLELFKEDIPYGKMADYLLATSYLPVFKTSKLDGKTFLDGGFYNNLPINMLQEKKYEKVIAVRLMSRGPVRINKTAKTDLLMIEPKQDLGKILDFSREKVDYNIQLGYFDTLKALNKLKGKNYYIEGGIKEEQSIYFFLQLSATCVKELGDILGIKIREPKNRALMEEILPKIAELMQLNGNWTYEELLLRIFEEMAAYKKIEVFHIYTPETLVERIKRKDVPMEKETEIEFLKSEIFLRFNKEKRVEEVIKTMLREKWSW